MAVVSVLIYHSDLIFTSGEVVVVESTTVAISDSTRGSFDLIKALIEQDVGKV